MQAKVMDNLEWAATEFAGAQLGDTRRTTRLIGVARALAENPQGALPGSFSQRAELKAAYRLFAAQKVTHEAVTRPHCQRVRAGCQQPGEYLLVEDTTQLDFTSHPAAEELGFIGDGRGRGIMVHSTLALRVDHWDGQDRPGVTVVGLFGQRWWTRRQPFRKKTERKGDRLKRPRESGHWAAVLEQAGGPDRSARWTFVGDRESDIYEVFQRCRAKAVGYIVRASRPRALAKEDRSVFEAVARSPVLGRFSLNLRARPGLAAREVVMELRARSVRLRAPWRPGERQPPWQAKVVEAREVEAGEGLEPLRWMLLTSWACESFGEARRVVMAYTQRWLIEEYHKALKTGTKVEHSQLSTAERLASLLGVLAVVAARLLSLKLLASTRAQEPVDVEDVGPEPRAILEAHYGKPACGWTNASLLIAVARLGGFQARKGDGNPGWLTIWRGYKKLMLMADGFAMARGEKCG